jgi:threonine synthase
MRYLSTRGRADPAGFLDACLVGLAPDGGLYAPETWPSLARGSPRPYAEAAAAIIGAFAGGTPDEEQLRAMCVEAYAAFDHASAAPLVEVGPGRWMLELHHGPTLAFKDIAMRFIAQLYDHALAAWGGRMTILCATSGDTGGAAAAAFAGAANVDLVILHPHGRVSPRQRLFMAATGADNVRNLAIEGDFDACQAIVKRLLADARLKAELNLAAVNSINWARIAAQTVYFAQAQAQLGRDAPIRFVVPTGNFGDALAAWVAGRCGLLAATDIVAAVNANDAMARLLAGEGLAARPGRPTLSPAMDIQLPSNFERLLFEASGRDGAAVAALYHSFAAEGRARTTPAMNAAVADAGVVAERVSDAETLEEIRRTHAETGWIVCPHTAVGLAASRRRARADGPVVTLATAHAAKFPETTALALGVEPELPARAAPFLERPERFDVIPADEDVVRRHLAGLAAR